MLRLRGTRECTVVTPRWCSSLPAVQLFIAVLVLGLTAYGLSVHSESPIRPALILTITTAILTMLPMFPLTVPIWKAAVPPLATLFANLTGTLLWLASLVALASHLRIFNYYRKVENIPWAPGAPSIVAAWKCGVAACVFAGIEVLLFLVTLILFAYLYHHNRASTQPRPPFLRSKPRTPTSNPVALEGTSADVAGGGRLNQLDQTLAPVSLGQIEQQHNHHYPPGDAVFAAVPAPQPTAPAHPTSRHADYSNTNKTNAHRPAADDGSFPSAASPPPSQGHARPNGAGLGARYDTDRETFRPPYPVDDDEQRGVAVKNPRGYGGDIAAAARAAHYHVSS